MTIACLGYWNFSGGSLDGPNSPSSPPPVPLRQPRSSRFPHTPKPSACGRAAPRGRRRQRWSSGPRSSFAPGRRCSSAATTIRACIAPACPTVRRLFRVRREFQLRRLLRPVLRGILPAVLRPATTDPITAGRIRTPVLRPYGAYDVERQRADAGRAAADRGLHRRLLRRHGRRLRRHVPAAATSSLAITTIELYLPGHRPYQQRVYVQPGRTFNIRHTMEPLAPGEAEPARPAGAPLPQAGTQYPGSGTRGPARDPRAAGPASTNAGLRVPGPESRVPSPGPAAQGFGQLSLRVQPATPRCSSTARSGKAGSTPSVSAVQLGTGLHRLEIRKDGYRNYFTDITIVNGQTRTLNVALTSKNSESGFRTHQRHRDGCLPTLRSAFCVLHFAFTPPGIRSSPRRRYFRFPCRRRTADTRTADACDRLCRRARATRESTRAPCRTSTHRSSAAAISKVSVPSPPRQWPMPGTMNRRIDWSAAWPVFVRTLS